MVNRHIWATVLMAVMAISWVTAPAVQAQTTTANTDSVIANWSEPGSFPFVGNYSDVCTLYADQITGEQCARAIDEQERGLGEELFLQDGDILQVSFTVNGEHRSKILRVMFGDDISENDPMRRALVYDTGRSDGLKLVRPDVCGNWSLMTIRDAALPATVVEQLYEEEQYGCWLEARHRHGPGGEVSFLPGIDVGDSCGLPHFVPGLLQEGSSLQSNGQGLVCGFYPIH